MPRSENVAPTSREKLKDPTRSLFIVPKTEREEKKKEKKFVS